VLAAQRSSKVGRRGWTARYYLCRDDDVLWRIPNKLHGDIITGRIALPQFASTQQKVVEVLFRRSDGQIEIQARGTLYTFTSEGKFDPHPFAEAATEWSPPHPNHVRDRVVDITRSLTNRRWVREHTWMVSSDILRRVMYGRRPRCKRNLTISEAFGRRPRCKRNLTISEAFGCGHVWTAPAVQEESDYQRSVRVRSCIRPLNAAVWPLALM
jgi:hypothetical protein